MLVFNLEISQMNLIGSQMKHIIFSLFAGFFLVGCQGLNQLGNDTNKFLQSFAADHRERVAIKAPISKKDKPKKDTLVKRQQKTK